MSDRYPRPATGEPALAIVCGGGGLPFAIADAAIQRGRRVVLFPLRGWADPQRVKAYDHHWLWMGQANRFRRLATDAGCRDVVLIGSVARPSFWQIRPDLLTLRLLPEVFGAFRGGDDQLQSHIARLFEQHGFRIVGPQEIAPELLIPPGIIGSISPTDRDHKDIARGLALLRANSPFDIGQVVVVADSQILAVEGPEGTDRTLARVAQLRQEGRIRTPAGVGVMVKAAKIGQNLRVDLPSIGLHTLEGAAAARLAGIAVVARTTIIAEPSQLAAAADRAGIFVIGVEDDETPA